ncbi:MAG: tetratricopeptide repeat protein [Nannocystales bacterium]
MNVFALLLLLVAPMSPTDIERSIDRGDLQEAKDAMADADLSPVARATLRGRLALAESRPADAARQFEQAVELAPEHVPLRLLWAHALLRADRPGEVGAALKPLSGKDPAVARLRAAAEEANGNPGAAYAALEGASRANPDDLELKRQLVLLCAREGLLEPTRAWIETLTPKQLGRVMALAVLQEIRSDAHALPLARQLASAFPNDAEVHAQLGWVASSAGAPAEASRAFARAVSLGADEAYAGAEHARAAGRHREALRLNARVGDDTKRAEQRFDILFESGKLARAIAAAQSLRLSPRRRYNLAYAHYGLQQVAEASTHARTLTGTDYAARAQTLLRAMGR